MTDDDKISQLIVSIIDAATEATESLGLSADPQASRAAVSAVLTWMVLLAKDSGITKSDLLKTVAQLADATYAPPN